MFPLGYFYNIHHVRILHYVVVVHPPLPLRLHPNTVNIIIRSISIWFRRSTKLIHPIDISTDLFLGHFSLLPRVDTDEDGRPQLLQSRNLWSVLFQAKTVLTCPNSKQPPRPSPHSWGLWCKQNTLTHFLLDKSLFTFLRFVAAGQTR